MGISTRLRRGRAAAPLGLLLVGLFGCAGVLTGPTAYDYFGLPGRSDPWSRKISMWQARERADHVDPDIPAPAAVAGPATDAEEARPGSSAGDLRAKYASFRRDHKRAMARELATWIQSEARTHYRPDGPVDHWATLEETLRSNGDDCDGLELLVYHFLRDFGFESDEVYRAIVFRRADGQHHMVTLWFEDPNDPWVIDPTGAMTSGMPRMSQVPGWEPLKVFSEDEDFTVAREKLASN